MPDRCVECEDDHSSYVLKQWSDLSIVYRYYFNNSKFSEVTFNL